MPNTNRDLGWVDEGVEAEVDEDEDEDEDKGRQQS